MAWIFILGVALLFVLVLLAAVGFGVGVPELVIWFALVVGWVGLWWSRRRRPLR